MSLMLLEGLRPWLVQRVSAVVIALYMIYLLVTIGGLQSLSYDDWRGWFYAPENVLFSGLFIFSLLFHAWIGMRDVILDYVHNLFVRLLTLTIIMSVIIVSAIWTVKLLFIPVVV